MWGILLKTKKNKTEKSFSPIVAQIKLQNGIYGLYGLYGLYSHYGLYGLYLL